ncbi:uncharacterized protein [Palaemon carinicauda]|uniref:uncharacterized protein isoform X2 n=2 Tax=Palaemon carinicauda TaxID=392227 RepID=UPI0035B5D226
MDSKTRPTKAESPGIYAPGYPKWLPYAYPYAVPPVYHGQVNQFQIPQNYQNPFYFNTMPLPRANGPPSLSVNRQGKMHLYPTPPPLLLPPHRPFLPVPTFHHGYFRMQGPGTTPNTLNSHTHFKNGNCYSDRGVPLMREAKLPGQHILPLMPSVPHYSINSQILNLKFLDGSEYLKPNLGEMLIRGSTCNYNDSGAKVFLKSGTNLEIELDKDVVYVIGRKLNEEEKLHDVLALGTDIKAFIEKIHVSTKEEGSQELHVNIDNEHTAKYRVVVAWFGEVPDIKGLLPTIEESCITIKGEGDKDVAKSSCSKPYKKSKDDQCNDTPSNNDSSLSHFIGYVWWADKDNGILRIYHERSWGSEFWGIHFTCDVIHFEGQKVCCDFLPFLLAHLNKCDVKARKIDRKQIHGMNIMWEAVHVEFGQVPSSFKRKERDLRDESYSRCATGTSYDSSQDTVDSDLSRLDETLVHVDDGSKKLAHNETSFRTSKEMYLSPETSEIEKYSEKNLGERDLYMMNDLKISNDKDTVILENSKYLLSSLPKKYSGKHVTGHIIKLFSQESNIGIAQWKSMDHGCVNILFKQSDLYVDLVPLNKIMKLSSVLCERRCNLYVLPLEGQICSKFKVKLAATCGWLGTKPLSIPTPGEQPKAQISLSHIKPEVSVNESIVGLSSITMAPLNNTKDVQLRKKKAKVLIGEDTSLCKENNTKDYKEGKVVELHSNIGKLESEDGITYYFFRDQCYLFGINLCHVELWHVLVHGEKVFYTLATHVKNQSKILEVLIGSRTSFPRKTNQIEDVEEWCRNNSVPDCAKDILVKQIRDLEENTYVS